MEMEQVFSMPEAALGLHTDCGSSYWLSRLNGFLGTYPSSLSLDSVKYLLVLVDCLRFGSLMTNDHQFLNSGTNLFPEIAWSRLLRRYFFTFMSFRMPQEGIEWVILVMYLAH
jgi:hypothetical protein